MYRKFYHLNCAPFASVDHPDPLFLSPRHQTALEQVAAAVAQQQGLVVLTGEAGLGKTTLLRSVLASSPPLQTFFISNNELSFIHHAAPKELISSIKRELGQHPDTGLQSQTLSEMINDLQEFFIQAGKQGTNVAVVIDNAHLLPSETLRILPQIINIFPYRQKFAQLVLVGHPDLEQRICGDPKLQELRNQITTFVTLPRLKKKESQAYITTKLQQAALANRTIISNSAINTIVNHARGVPRNINILCTDALTTGFQQQKKPISKRLVQQVISEFEDKPVHRATHLGWLSATGAVLVASLVMLFLMGRLSTVTSASQAMLQLAKPKLQQFVSLTSSTSTSSTVTTTVEPEPPSRLQTAPVPAPPPEPSPAVTTPDRVTEPAPARPPERSVAASTPVVTPAPAAVPAPAQVPAPPPLTGTLQQVAALIKQSFSNHDDFRLQVWANKGGQNTYTEGEKLLVHVLASTDAYLQVDYYQADGQVVHLLPNSLDQNQVQSGQIFTLGKPENTFQFEIAPPFGVEMLTVVASQAPFDRQLGRPTIEPANDYLKHFARQLKGFQDQGGGAAAYVHIQTRKEFPTRLSQTVNP